MSMTESEAIEEMSHYSEEEYGKGAVAESHKMAIIALEEIQQYRAIGTVSEFRELKEKATAKKPTIEVYAQSLYERKTYRCPSCNQKLVTKIDGSWCGGALSLNCPYCGQKIDWSEGKE